MVEGKRDGNRNRTFYKVSLQFLLFPVLPASLANVNQFSVEHEPLIKGLSLRSRCFAVAVPGSCRSGFLPLR